MTQSFPITLATTSLSFFQVSLVQIAQIRATIAIFLLSFTQQSFICARHWGHTSKYTFHPQEVQSERRSKHIVNAWTEVCQNCARHLCHSPPPQDSDSVLQSNILKKTRPQSELSWCYLPFESQCRSHSISVSVKWEYQDLTCLSDSFNERLA